MKINRIKKNRNWILIFLLLALSCDSSTKKDDDKRKKEVILKTNIYEKESNINFQNYSPGFDSIVGYNYLYEKSGGKYWKYYYKEIKEFRRIIKIKRDFIEPNSIIINGVLPNFSHVNFMIEKLGQPDSVILIRDAMYNGSLYFYPNMKFRVNDYDSIAFLELFLFKNNETFISYKGTIYNYKTPLTHFKKKYPLSFINASENKKNQFTH